jgi:hypothetical protein
MRAILARPCARNIVRERSDYSGERWNSFGVRQPACLPNEEIRIDPLGPDVRYPGEPLRCTDILGSQPITHVTPQDFDSPVDLVPVVHRQSRECGRQGQSCRPHISTDADRRFTSTPQLLEVFLKMSLSGTLDRWESRRATRGTGQPGRSCGINVEVGEIAIGSGLAKPTQVDGAISVGLQTWVDERSIVGGI